jgi:hypothetical protein
MVLWLYADMKHILSTMARSSGLINGVFTVIVVSDHHFDLHCQYPYIGDLLWSACQHIQAYAVKY